MLFRSSVARFPVYSRGRYEMPVHQDFALDQDCAFGATLSHHTFGSHYGVVLEGENWIPFG